MSESKNHFLFEFLVLLCCISFQNVSGVKVELTRSEGGDYFTNPYSMSADNDGDKFCLSTNAICFKDYPKIGYKCRYCKCDKVKTFNETSLRCASIQDFGQGCRAWLRSHYIKLLDLTNSGETTLFTVSVKRARLARILRLNGMKVDFFTVKNKPYYKDNRLAIQVKWENVPKTTYDGQVFRVQISYRTYNNTNINDCFVFKSKGTINVTFPDLTTTSPLPSTSEKLTIQTSPFHTVLPSTVTIIPALATTPPLPLASEKSTIQTSLSHTVSHTPVTIPTLTTTAPSPSTIEKSTTAPLPKTKPGPTNVARKEESSGGGKNAIILSLAVVGCLLLLGVVILAVLWCRERSARLSQDKKNTEISLANGSNGSVEDPMVMSQVGSSQTEAGNSINSSEVDEDNHEYYNAEGDVDNYASLDMTKAESKPTYQSLINVERDLLV